MVNISKPVSGSRSMALSHVQSKNRRAQRERVADFFISIHAMCGPKVKNYDIITAIVLLHAL